MRIIGKIVSIIMLLTCSTALSTSKIEKVEQHPGGEFLYILTLNTGIYP